MYRAGINLTQNTLSN